MHPLTKVEQLNKVGPKYLSKLNKIGIFSVKDLLFYFPHRYNDFSQTIPIEKLEPDKIFNIQGEIIKSTIIRTRTRKMTMIEITVEDETGSVKALWFNQAYLANTLKEGRIVNLSGKLSLNKKKLCFYNPTYEVIASDKDTTHTARLVPVYHETTGLSSRYLRYLIKPLLLIAGQLEDFIPNTLRDKYNLISLSQAIQFIHFPKSQEEILKARKRLAFNELFLIQLATLKQRQKINQQKAPVIRFNESLIKPFVKKLPFKLTDDQRIAAWQALQDIEKAQPMNRLLNGDVGSGKTIVAAILCLQTNDSKYQAAFMAPTEILAKQHFETFRNLLKGYKLKIALLTSNESIINSRTTTKKILKEKLSKGEINIVIGTHALIQKDVFFKKLALVIIDEQHRFGVNQRAALQDTVYKMEDGLKTIPHLLSMTATPIPRTLTLTVYGNLDVSLIKEMPLDRKKVVTKLITHSKKQDTYEFIKKEIKKGRQAFVICPLIEKTVKEQDDRLLLDWEIEKQSVNETYNKLKKKIFHDLKIEMLHGKLKAKEKDEIMQKFKKGTIDILVSTSVVEVGIDVPNATLMIIEDADKFGLAQLHQFRGRIGRSKYQSYCFLFTTEDKKESQRLQAVLKSRDGFELAKRDLELRGPGSLTGLRQSGLPDLVMASLNDLELIQKSRQAALEIMKKYPNSRLIEDQLASFRKNIHLE